MTVRVITTSLLITIHCWRIVGCTEVSPPSLVGQPPTFSVNSTQAGRRRGDGRCLFEAGGAAKPDHRGAWPGRQRSLLSVRGEEVALLCEFEQIGIGSDEGCAEVACGGHEDAIGGVGMHVEGQPGAGDGDFGFERD